jgi:hypothetical protein
MPSSFSEVWLDHTKIWTLPESVLEKLGASLPEDVDTSLPEAPSLEFPWEAYQFGMDFRNFPLQASVDLVSFLVNLQGGRAKFVDGVPTVGGRTRIGLITPHEGFRMLNEPEIVHRNLGFGHDA